MMNNIPEKAYNSNIMNNKKEMVFVSRMFEGRQTPWSGIGKNIQEAKSLDDALKMGDLDWEVKQQPIYFQGDRVELGNGKAQIHMDRIPNKLVNVRADNNYPLGVVSDNYKVVQNRQGFDILSELIGTNEVEFDTALNLKGGSIVCIMAKMKEEVVVGDKVAPYLAFYTRHDGKGSIMVFMSPIRIWCQNMLNLALKQSPRKWSTVHAGDMDSKLEDARITLGLAKNYMTEFKKEADILSQQHVSDAQIKEIINELYPVMALEEDGSNQKKIDNVKIIHEELEARIKNAPDLSKFKNTGWAVINGVSDFITHAEPKRESPTFKENLFINTVTDNSLMDKAYTILSKVA